VVEQRQTQGAVTDVTSYVYTKAGRLSAIASPSGLITEYTRDALGKIHSVVVTPANGGPASIVSSASYLPFGPLLSYTLGNGQTLTRTYDANYEVSDVSSPTISLHFSRDAAGNIVGFGQASGANPATESYTYDPLYRLTGVNDSSGHAIEAYTYSRAGDRLSKTASGLSTGAYSYQATTHWLTGIGVASRAYDQKGSMTANASAGIAWSYGYDLRGNLAVAQQGGVTIATYGYNAFAQRVSKAVGQQAPQRFVYADDGQLLFEGGDIARDYIWMDTVPVAVVDPSQSGVSIGFIHADGLGTPRSVTNEVGSQLWSWPFAANAFGELPPSSTTGFALSLRFPGQYFDTETSMVYNGNRYYDPTVGRYLQSDPLGMVDSPSTYAYVSSNPLAWVDPEGLANSGQWKQVPGTNSQVRMDPAHVEGQQPHVHVQTKGFPEVAINVDGTPSHSSDLSKMSRAKKLLKFLRSNGFAVKCLSGVQDVFFIRDIVSGVSAEQCEQGDIAACQTYQFLQGQDPADNVPHA
jgi:RHS repeat-associated protein